MQLRVARIRNGRKVRRTIYIQRGPEPDDSDPLVGTMDYPELAELVVAVVNYCHLDPGTEALLERLAEDAARRNGTGSEGG